MSITSISEAKLRLYHLVRQAEGGEDVVLEYEGRPIARIQPIAPNDLAEARARAIDAAHAFCPARSFFWRRRCRTASQRLSYKETFRHSPFTTKCK
jgi:prevent-host-death family protein